ncbi:hypothetical protein CANDROIZ_270002 [Candidatus Roizmanbacteria bacterium]|nr:hypothetical protein CANDROIZ_270002 [Candidatus Roizmanbacteria bacterium]
MENKTIPETIQGTPIDPLIPAVQTTQPIVPTVIPEPTPKRNHIKTIIIVVILGLIIGTIIYFLFKSTNKSNSNSIIAWNTVDNYDSSIFTGERYKSGKTYFNDACFDSNIPKQFEILDAGFSPRVGVVKPIGPRVTLPYIDVAIGEVSGELGEDILTEKYNPSNSTKHIRIEELTPGSNRKVTFDSIKLFDRTSKAIIVEYNPINDTSQKNQLFDISPGQNISAINVFVMGRNKKTIVNLLLVYDASNKERDVKMFKQFLQSFKPVCYFKRTNVLQNY